MKEKHEETSVGKKWWLIISTTIFLLLTLVTVGFLGFELQYYQSQKIALTEKYREQLSEKLSEYEAPLTSANIVATLNQNNSYQKDKDSVYQKNFILMISSSMYKFMEQIEKRSLEHKLGMMEKLLEMKLRIKSRS